LQLNWDRIIAAWALVWVLILEGSAAVQMAHAIDRAEAHPVLWGAKIPQHDPFNLGSPAFEDNSSAAEVDN
jgi:hypothetical protein